MSKKNSLKRAFKILLVLGVLALTASVSFAQDTRPWTTEADRATTDRPLPAQIGEAMLAEPLQMEVANLADLRLSPELRGLSGRQQVVVRLGAPATAATSTDLSLQRQAAVTQQSALISSARAIDGSARVLSSVQQLGSAIGVGALGTLFWHTLASTGATTPVGGFRDSASSALFLAAALLAAAFVLTFLLPERARSDTAGH